MKTDVVIIGGGPAGTATALYLEKEGIPSVIVEKDEFPRYHIGESLTGECGKCLRTLGFADEMKQYEHPVKRGVKVYGPNGKNAFYVPVMTRSDEGELAVSSTWSMPRDAFDKMMMDKAIARGATLVKGRATAPILNENGGVRGVEVRTADDKNIRIEAEVVVDASGPATFLSNKGVAGKKSRGNYSRQIAVFSQVKNAIRDEGPTRGDTLIFFQKKNHWSWFIPLDDGTVSVGVTVPSDYFLSKNESKHDFLVRELHEVNPEIKRRIPEVVLTEEARAISNYSYHIKEFTGDGFLCVGDSHRFIDPIFSFGVYFGIKEGEFSAKAIKAYLDGETRGLANPFADYQRQSEVGQDVIQALIDAFWNEPLAFAFFAHSRYKDDFVDMFAGRIYTDEESPGLVAMKKIAAGAMAKMDSESEFAGATAVAAA